MNKLYYLKIKLNDFDYTFKSYSKNFQFYNYLNIIYYLRKNF